MVIDFRIRPPYKGFMNLGIVRNWQSVPDDPRKMRPTGFERLPVPSMEHASVDMLVDEMKAAGITKGVLHGRHTGNARYGDVSNAEVNELLLRYPGLFVALAGISPNAPDALEEIEHCVRDWGFKGVALDPGWCSPAMYATDPKIEPILDLCQQLGVFVSITMSAYGGPDLSYCDPTPLVPMLRKFPKVNVVIPHGCWPKVQEAVGVALLCPNLYLAPDCYFFLRNMPMRHEYANAANSFLKYRFLFSTSYPIRGFAQAIEDWKNAGLEPESLQRRAGGRETLRAGNTRPGYPFPRPPSFPTGSEWWGTDSGAFRYASKRMERGSPRLEPFPLSEHTYRRAFSLWPMRFFPRKSAVKPDRFPCLHGDPLQYMVYQSKPCATKGFTVYRRALYGKTRLRSGDALFQGVRHLFRYKRSYVDRTAS